MSTADELMAVIRIYAKNPTTHNEYKVRATLTDFLPFADQEPNATDLQSNEQYRMQMAAISTAALGYWKEGDDIRPEYDTLALRDVARLYVKYASFHSLLREAVEYLIDAHPNGDSEFIKRCRAALATPATERSNER